MKLLLVIFFLAAGLPAPAELPFPLPPKAKYTASGESITKAKAELTARLSADSASLEKLFIRPMLCGPGLWNILKDSPHFAKPPTAKSTVKVPMADGKIKELQLALLQADEEVASFRKALADLLKSQGRLTIREPNKEEFMKYWATIPFDEITDPLLVAEGKEVTIFCQFTEGRVFWADEVKRSNFDQ